MQLFHAILTALADAFMQVGVFVAVLVGGVLAGGLAIADALPGATGPVHSVAVVTAAALVAVATVVVPRRLRPLDQARSRR